MLTFSSRDVPLAAAFSFFFFFFIIFNLVLLSLGLLNFNVSFLLFNASHFLVFNSNSTVITSGFSLSLRRELNKCLLIK